MHKFEAIQSQLMEIDNLCMKVDSELSSNQDSSLAGSNEIQTT